MCLCSYVYKYVQHSWPHFDLSTSFVNGRFYTSNQAKAFDYCEPRFKRICQMRNTNTPGYTVQHMCTGMWDLPKRDTLGCLFDCFLFVSLCVRMCLCVVGRGVCRYVLHVWLATVLLDGHAHTRHFLSRTLISGNKIKKHTYTRDG